jgi:hypothetical protein
MAWLLPINSTDIAKRKDKNHVDSEFQQWHKGRDLSSAMQVVFSYSTLA